MLLRVRPKGKTETREVIVKPISMQDDTRPALSRVGIHAPPEGGAGVRTAKIGYVHLRAMGENDINQWVEEYTPVFTREGLIIDVRHNGGGNIDSWILGKLMRKAWMYWQPRVGEPYLEHAAGVSRPHGGAVRRMDGFRWRGVYGRLPPPWVSAR